METAGGVNASGGRDFPPQSLGSYCSPRLYRVLFRCNAFLPNAPLTPLHHSSLYLLPQGELGRQRGERNERKERLSRLHTLTPPVSSPRLLLLSHGRMMYYDLETGGLDILDEGHGVYYGGFELGGQLHYISRPHNWKEDPAAKEYLINHKTGARLQLPSKFTHDVVAYKTGVYVADTGNGNVVEVAGGGTSPVVGQVHELFTAKEHVNTLAVDVENDRYMWAMLHNLGPSVLARVDMYASPSAHSSQGLHAWQIVERIEGVGQSSHGIVQYESQGRRKIVFLDSNEVSLGMVDLESKGVDIFYRLEDADPEMTFLKGLCVVDDVAFFGIAPSSPRSSRADKSLECEVGAYDLLNNRLLFRKRMPTKGLLNVIAAPDLAEDSTQRALRTPNGAFRRAAIRLSEDVAGSEATMWSTGWPRLDNSLKNQRSGFAGGTQLMLYRKDLTLLKQRLEPITPEQYDAAYQLEHNAWIGGRDDVLTTFKPGTKSFHLIFSGRDGHGVYEFPWYDKFSDLLEPLFEELLGSQSQNIMRAQFALMPAHTEIKPHVDSGGYSSEGHRIHFVVQSNPLVSFSVCESSNERVRLNTEEGSVFELNNRLKHHVQNASDQDRIHLVVDVAESPRERTKLRVGQRCEYTHGTIVCD